LSCLSGAPELLKLFKQPLRLDQIARVEPLRKPPVNRSQQFARFAHLALVAPEAGEAHGGAEFPGLGLLLTGAQEGALEVRFGLRSVSLRRCKRDFAGRAIKLGVPPPFLDCFDRRDCFVDAAPSVVELTKMSVSLG
jgi:hypothetical protein